LSSQFLLALQHPKYFSHISQTTILLSVW